MYFSKTLISRKVQATFADCFCTQNEGTYCQEVGESGLRSEDLQEVSSASVPIPNVALFTDNLHGCRNLERFDFLCLVVFMNASHLHRNSEVLVSP